MNISEILLGIGIVILVFAVTYPIACWTSGADEIIKQCEEIGSWAKDELERRTDAAD